MISHWPCLLTCPLPPIHPFWGAPKSFPGKQSRPAVLSPRRYSGQPWAASAIHIFSSRLWEGQKTVVCLPAGPRPSMSQGPPALPGKQCKLFLTIWEWKGSSASKNSHWVNSQKCLEVHPLGNVKWMELQIWKILHVGFYTTSTYFFNGLYLSLKNPESIQSTLENFFFFFQNNLHGSWALLQQLMRDSNPQKQDHKKRSCS